MAEWAVIIDDPDMAKAHAFVVKADSEEAAKLEGARLSILRDRLGGGIGAPAGTDWSRYEMPLAERERQAAEQALVGACALWARAVEIE